MRHRMSEIADVVLTAPHELHVLPPSLAAPHLGQSEPCMVKMAYSCGAESVFCFLNSTVMDS
jgi:hypothetical protein